MEYVINLSWDNEAGVWTATSRDIPGLVLEASSYDDLIERTKSAIPELLELNSAVSRDLSLVFISERRERMML